MKRYRRRKRPLHKAVVIAVLPVILCLLIFLTVRLDRAVRPAAQLQSEHIARMTANRIISETVADYITENDYTYGDFAAVLYDESGHAASVEALSGNINRIQAELTKEINFRLSGDKSSHAEIAFGSLIGSYLFAGRGPSVKVRICPAGDATVKLKSSFDSAGINQSRHRIYAEINTELISALPIYSFETEESFELLLAETIIVGDVPDYTVRAWSEMGNVPAS